MGERLTPTRIASGGQKQRLGNTGGGAGVEYTEDGEELIPEIPEKMINWLLSWPNQEPRTMREFCENVEHTWRGTAKTGITQRTYYRWKNDPRFHRWLTDEARKLNVSPERRQTAINSIYEVMVDPALKPELKLRAAEMYVKISEKFLPPEQLADMTGGADSVSEMSDEELKAAISEWTGDYSGA